MEEFKITRDEKGTIVFCIEENQWRGADDYSPEGFANSGKDAFCFKDGELWMQNIPSGNRSEFFGQPVKSVIGVLIHPEGGKPKLYETISIESNIAPTLASFSLDEPIFQSTILKAPRFQKRNGVFYSPILRAGSGNARIKGKKMCGPTMRCAIEFDTRDHLRLSFINVGYKNHVGHEFI